MGAGIGRAEGTPKFDSTAEPVRRVARQASLNDLIEQRGDCHAQRPRRRWVLGQPSGDCLRLAVRGERYLTGQRFIEHAAHRVDVGPCVDDGPGGLFGAHVRGCAERDSGLRQVFTSRGVHGPGNPEIGHDRVTGREEDVLRFDVPVHDALFMSVCQRAA